MKLDSSISAVITGGASGLGAATARALANHGVKVALFDLNEDKGDESQLNHLPSDIVDKFLYFFTK